MLQSVFGYAIKIGMMNLPTPLELEIKALRAGTTMAQVSKLAKVNAAVFQRWKIGKSQPNMKKLTALMLVLDGLPVKNEGAA